MTISKEDYVTIHHAIHSSVSSVVVKALNIRLLDAVMVAEALKCPL